MQTTLSVDFVVVVALVRKSELDNKIGDTHRNASSSWFQIFIQIKRSLIGVHHLNFFVPIQDRLSIHQDSTMSRSEGPHRGFLPIGNPFKMMMPKTSHLPSTFLTAFEKNLAKRFQQLKPNHPNDVITFSWMKSALSSICDTLDDCFWNRYREAKIRLRDAKMCITRS
ncbi:unnamed protein product [Lactuca virosa]|uniref:Uncharacterized protein n=1 Tax=Lactuca virosa TaxID=75947 RepID=A0AAU9LR61_9ASTR|nr:unnamed protein product [Lactuca virosa]